ncbi:hypothetical protein AAFF_G00370580 [Aldrovandia affinis]|uniref:Uncharacterized protein n=1 Tax=Aldrovandia affinis TaxID=143900 RepID=A0AAD7WMH3_9TELE|nr:hypothetical protein AAFF_G00370580 [Aldrovandia affinis]
MNKHIFKTESNHDPAEAEQFRTALAHQGAMVGEHQQLLRNISETAVPDCGDLPHNPASPTASAPTSSGTEEPRLSCQGFLIQWSLVFELQPSLFLTDQSKVVYIIILLSDKALAIWKQHTPNCWDFLLFTSERVFDHPEFLTIPETNPSPFSTIPCHFKPSQAAPGHPESPSCYK